jgi:hypothetical protein
MLLWVFETPSSANIHPGPRCAAFLPTGASSLRTPLFVAQGFDGVEAGGADGGDHAADQSDGGEDEDGDDQSDRVDHQADVAGFGVFGHGAVEGESANGEATT